MVIRGHAAGRWRDALYTSLTDQWDEWATLWTVVPFSFGRPLRRGWLADAPAFKWIGAALAAPGWSPISRWRPPSGARRSGSSVPGDHRPRPRPDGRRARPAARPEVSAFGPPVPCSLTDASWLRRGSTRKRFLHPGTATRLPISAGEMKRRSRGASPSSAATLRPASLANPPRPSLPSRHRAMPAGHQTAGHDDTEGAEQPRPIVVRAARPPPRWVAPVSAAPPARIAARMVVPVSAAMVR